VILDGNPALSKSDGRGWVCWVESGSLDGDSRFSDGAVGSVGAEPAATDVGTEIR